MHLQVTVFKALNRMHFVVDDAEGKAQLTTRRMILPDSFPAVSALHCNEDKGQIGIMHDYCIVIM